ncbi:MAG: carboxypeptidase M32 [Gemmatimonadetes bacterium]|nr:carboxypeptidase M32 [Gemmatimonadota bacterium]
MSDAYTHLLSHFKQTALLGSCESVLGWDERTYMPRGGAAHRADQIALLAGLVHDRVTEPSVDGWLQAIEADEPDAGSVEAVNVREWRRAYDRATRMPKTLVEEIARVTTVGQQVWMEARANDDFDAFEEILADVVRLKREEARLLAEGTSLYDALLEDYEPGETTENLQRVFGPLKEALVPLVARVGEASVKPDLSILHREYPEDAQSAFGTEVAAAIGFDFERGRLDVTTHPFCSGLGPGDTRITTRYDRHELNQAFFGILHEAGHGVYDQGLSPEHWGTPMGSAVSLGIHESQSRLWENFVGRSPAFWRQFYPKLKAAFPGVLDDVDESNFVLAVNDVRPSFIRVEADEATYNLHIMLRFELEQALIEDELQAADVPSAWNELFESYFGMRPESDASGCLQDIHWSGGGIGYFPTYTLGNLYAAALFDQAGKDLGDLDAQFEAGEFGPLLQWLTTKVYNQGMRYYSNDLSMVITGTPLSHEPLIGHLTRKYETLYGI